MVLSGDDLTVILRGDLAIPYIRSFLTYFETLTAEDDAIKDLVKTGKGLTACAGIAFMKSSYPFYYGYRLAEELCGRAKRSAKRIDAELAPSCLMFHKVQDSFVEDFDEIARRELTPAPGHSFEFGPYFLEEQAGYARIDDLTRWTGALSVRENKAVKGHLRQWIGWMYRGDAGVGLAEQKKRRLKVLWEGKSATWEWVDALLSGLTAEDGEGALDVVFHGIDGDAQFLRDLVILFPFEAAFPENLAGFGRNAFYGTDDLFLQFFLEEAAQWMFITRTKEKRSIKRFERKFREARLAPFLLGGKMVQAPVAHRPHQISTQGGLDFDRIAHLPEMENHVLHHALGQKRVAQIIIRHAAKHLVMVRIEPTPCLRVARLQESDDNPFARFHPYILMYICRL